MNNTEIKTTKFIYPQIYAYSLPDISDNDGWLKIGYTERLKHILENQVYGFAPSEIIYNIARNFIFGFDEKAKNINQSHIVHLDTTLYAKEGLSDEFEKKCDELFGYK